MPIRDCSSDVCSSDLGWNHDPTLRPPAVFAAPAPAPPAAGVRVAAARGRSIPAAADARPRLPGRRRRLALLGERETRRRARALGRPDRKSVVWGTSVSVRVDLGGRRIITKTTVTTD